MARWQMEMRMSIWNIAVGDEITAGLKLLEKKLSQDGVARDEIVTGRSCWRWDFCQ